VGRDDKERGSSRAAASAPPTIIIESPPAVGQSACGSNGNGEPHVGPESANTCFVWLVIEIDQAHPRYDHG